MIRLKKSGIILLALIAILNYAQGQDTLYKTVIRELAEIDELDQRYRNQIDFYENKYGRNSEEIKALYKSMNMADSVNLIKVENIITKYGWLGYNEVGSQANTALFMVIQHSNVKTWQRYLPIIKEAVSNGKAKASHLALLEDRLSLFEGKKQIYGSQIIWSSGKNKYIVLPLNDPDNVDRRRAGVGLPTLGEYLSHWNIKWNIEEYKKDLPEIIEECKNYFPSHD